MPFLFRLALLIYCSFLVVMILCYAALFQHLMMRLEGREYSYIAGIYWVITVMTTLGFGDITFHSDPNYIFAGIVTLSGGVSLLILLPFGMVSLFLAPGSNTSYATGRPRNFPKRRRGM